MEQVENDDTSVPLHKTILPAQYNSEKALLNRLTDSKGDHDDQHELQKLLHNFESSIEKRLSTI